MMHALPKIRKGGFLVLDNSERAYYLEKMNDRISAGFDKIVNGMGPTPYSREFTRTTVWKKRQN
jgi:hypothetical protein